MICIYCIYLVLDVRIIVTWQSCRLTCCSYLYINQNLPAPASQGGQPTSPKRLKDSKQSTIWSWRSSVMLCSWMQYQTSTSLRAWKGVVWNFTSRSTSYFLWVFFYVCTKANQRKSSWCTVWPGQSWLHFECHDVSLQAPLCMYQMISLLTHLPHQFL